VKTKVWMSEITSRGEVKIKFLPKVIDFDLSLLKKKVRV
jgi:hypothetical protein